MGGQEIGNLLVLSVLALGVFTKGLLGVAVRLTSRVSRPLLTVHRYLWWCGGRKELPWLPAVPYHRLCASATRYYRRRSHGTAQLQSRPKQRWERGVSGGRNQGLIRGRQPSATPRRSVRPLFAPAIYSEADTLQIQVQVYA